MSLAARGGGRLLGAANAGGRAVGELGETGYDDAPVASVSARSGMEVRIERRMKAPDRPPPRILTDAEVACSLRHSTSGKLTLRFVFR